MWELIHPDVSNAARAIAETGKYDDAIFAAFRVGDALITEAFDGNPPKINISTDIRDRQGIRDLFSGALKNIRNDRGHKKSPLTPCKSPEDCALYLSFASFLLYLLSRDKNTFPRIDSVRILGNPEQPRAELRGINFTGRDVRAIAGNGVAGTLVRKTPTVLEILLPQHFFGPVAIEVDGKLSGDVFCDVKPLDKSPSAHYEVIAADLDVYSEKEGRTKRPDVVGLLLRSVDASREFVTVLPTHPHRYAAGQYVTHGPTEPGTSIGESWYIDPNTGVVEYAWTGSMIFVPTILGTVGAFKLGGISILPKIVQTQVGENRCLRVLGWGRDGPLQKEIDITDRGKWRNFEPGVAFVERGIVFPKKLGKARAECEHEGFVSSIEISVEHLLQGQRTTYFQGVRRLQQIRFDADDNLYFCNQGPSVFRLAKAGNLAEVIRISTSPRAAAGIDCLSVDKDKNIYVNDVSKSAAFKFEWNGSEYVNPTAIASTIVGTKKSIVVSDLGDCFIAVMGPPGQGWIVRREVNGKESAFPVRGMPIWMAMGPDGNLYVPIVADSTILVYDQDGTLKEDIPYKVKNAGVGDILVGKDKSLYLAFFHTGTILRIFFAAPLWRAEFLPHNFGTPGGIAIDSRGRLYVSDFSGDTIDVVY
jgi:hypothetical protein